jgi:hypothetical protein
MNAASIIALAQSHSVTLTAKDSRIIAGPKAQLTAELREGIKAHKPELLKVLCYENRTTGVNPDTESHRGNANTSRQQATLPCATRCDDERTKDDATDAQGGIDADVEGIDTDFAADARRKEVLRMLIENPGITYAIVSDTELDPDAVIVTLAIRDKATCELRVPKAKYDGLALLQIIEQQASGTPQ